MCGITGIHSVAGEAPISSDLLEAMNGCIVHRGPDSAGQHIEAGRVGLAMRRLAILDVAGGDQPISAAGESLWIVFNGEIYNFRELRAELESRGHRFRSQGDTEVVLHAYQEYGDACVERLRGMFAFAVWDAARRRLFLARDRVGVKQLYYTRVGAQLLFGSEIKCLLAHPGVQRRLRPASLNHFLTWGYVPEPLTIFEDIHELPAAHTLVAERGQLALRRYWSLRYAPQHDMDGETAARGLRERLEEAVRVRMISDAPLGAFLSGGIDSGSIVALMAGQGGAAVKTFSIGYDVAGEAFDERAYARELAQRYGTEHREFVVQPDLGEVLPRLVRAFDQPAADASAIPTWYLAECTRKHVTVALSGVGGDELAAGYERHRGVILAERLGQPLGGLPRWLLQRLLRPLVRLLPDARSGAPWSQRAKRFARTLELPFEARYLALLSIFAAESREALLAPELLEQIALDEPDAHFAALLAEVDGADPLNQALYADLRLFLPSNLLTLTDRMSMAHSLEVRVPFVDHELLEYAATVPPGLKLRGMERKHVLKRAVADLLPESFLRRRKMGFSLPLAVWFRGPLRDFVEDLLCERAIVETGVFRYAAVRQLLDEHASRRANHDDAIWALLSFMTWHRDYLGSGSAATTHSCEGAA